MSLQTGLVVTGSTKLDTQLLNEYFEASEFYAEYNEIEGYFFLPEEIDLMDNLQVILNREIPFSINYCLEFQA